MGGAWYDDLPEDAFKNETDEAYNEAAATIRKGLENGLGFDEACAAISVPDEELRKNIVEDMLKVMIAEEHFGKDVPIETLAEKLKVPVSRLEETKKAMMEDVKNSSIKAFYKSIDHGNA